MPWAPTVCAEMPAACSKCCLAWVLSPGRTTWHVGASSLTVSVIMFLLLRFDVRTREAALAGPAPQYGRRTFNAASPITRGAGMLFHRQESPARRHPAAGAKVGGIL